MQILIRWGNPPFLIEGCLNQVALLVDNVHTHRQFVKLGSDALFDGLNAIIFSCEACGGILDNVNFEAQGLQSGTRLCAEDRSDCCPKEGDVIAVHAPPESICLYARQVSRCLLDYDIALGERGEISL